MKKRALWITIISVFILSSGYLAGREAGDTAKAANERTQPVRLTKLGFGDIIKSITDKKSDEKEKTQETADEPKSRLERRFDLLKGVGTLLSSSKEVDYDSERTIGESLALEGFQRYGMPLENSEIQKYVNLVGTAVARNSQRPGLPYRFVVVDSPLQNAFSCPGGIIFLSSGLLKTMDSESQLACVLAHEVEHVGHKHALQSIQRARFFEGVGKITAASMKGKKGQEYESMIGNLQTVLFDKGLDKNMEFEADASGMETAYKSGYDPGGMIEVLEKLKSIEAGSKKAGSWFSTHPPLRQRISRCKKLMSEYKDSDDLADLAERYREIVGSVK